ncbi:AraC family transcriptional regulator [Flavobacterium sp. SM15]|uniref:helix-turn-helix domain-containing protein n=1 Tax=Flavobacterium sp. SM15 TaxID=2908005 RepID=UPI001EDB077B|nr:helix-turn-helix domain-containing protein [Flavobacterium sp. SM15]MCG2610070.1 AraC family transcriptional regulator [Flavobacterium sp. SM15]
MRRFIYWIVLLISFVGFSQKKTTLSEEEYSVLFAKVRLLLNSNVDSAMIVSNRIEMSDNLSHKAFAFGAKSYLFQIKGDSLKSNLYYEKSLAALDQVKSSKEKTKLNAYIINYKGLTYWKRGEFSKALKFYQQGMKMSQSVGDIMQIVKFNNNISIINKEVGNYQMAIKASKLSEKIMNANQGLYTPSQFRQGKSNINTNLGSFYEEGYAEDKDNKKLLDSAEYYYKKAILYSKDLFSNRINAQKNLANIYYLKNQYKEAENIYQSTLQLAKEHDLVVIYCNISYNLGDLYFETKRYKQALVLFQRVDSIYKKNKTNELEYVRSNYYQSKIYKDLGDKENAMRHSQIYLDNFEKFESELNAEVLKVNNHLSNQNLKKEMIDLQKDMSFSILLRRLSIVFFIVLVLGLVAFSFKQYRDKKRINERINSLIDEFKNKTSVIEAEEEVTEVQFENIETSEPLDNSEPLASPSMLSIDEEKEKEIVKKLKSLERKQEFLKPNFTQQAVAKKIKTNTTYLSYVVNKSFGKTFSEYSNELKINYVIDQMINNPTYRKYSTQAIAESVGFKNAVSFTKSFSKRTGVSPTQFAKRLMESESLETIKEL